jgi:endonuclease/exonuclease/phosphatase family metal-dependent hydrolase
MLNKRILTKILITAGLALVLIMSLGGCRVPSDHTIVVMTYNILHGEGLDGKLDLDRTAEVIRQVNPTVVGLNEVDNNFSGRSKFINEPEYLAEKLGMHYVYGPALILGDPKKPNMYGNALLSKHPIKKMKNHKLYHQEGQEPRICIEATIDIKGVEYTFMVTHLDHQSTEVRVKQAQDIAKITGDRPGKTILMGDFNAPPPLDGQDEEAAKRSRPIAVIMEKFKDTFVLAGNGSGGSSRSRRRIDYIFVSPDLAENVQECEVIYNDLTAIASDHRPVVAQIKQ